MFNSSFVTCTRNFLNDFYSNNSYLLANLFNWIHHILVFFDIFVGAVPHCKERWRNLRACLTRHLKQQNTTITDGSPAHKPYYLAEHMEFLLPFTRSRSNREQSKYDTLFEDFTTSTPAKSDANAETTTTYTIESDDNQYVTLIQTTSAAEPMQSPNEIHEAPTKVERLNDSTEHGSGNVVTASKEHVQEIIYETVPSKRVKVANNEYDDADMEFLRSLLPDIRLMNASQKRRFKMRIFGLIEDVLSNTENHS